MSKLLELTFEAGSEGATATLGNTANGAYTFTNMEATSVFGALAAHHGQFGMLSPSGATSAYAYFDFSTQILSFRFAFQYDTATPTGADSYLLRVGIGSTRYFGVHVNTAGYLRCTDFTGTSGVWTATTLLQTGWYWCQGTLQVGSATNNGRIKFDYYRGWGTTPVETGCDRSDVNLGAGVTLTRAYMLKYSTSAFRQSTDDILLTNEVSYPGPYTPAAAATAKIIGGALSNGGGWTIQGSGVYIPEQVLPQSSGDTNFLRSAGTGNNEEVTLRLAPIDAGSITVYVRARQSPGSTATTARVTVLEGATARHTEVITGLTSSFALYPIVLSAGENAAISDRAALKVKIEGSAV